MSKVTNKQIEEIIKKCLEDYTMGDNKTDKEEKESFIRSVMSKVTKVEEVSQWVNQLI